MATHELARTLNACRKITIKRYVLIKTLIGKLSKINIEKVIIFCKQKNWYAYSFNHCLPLCKARQLFQINFLICDKVIIFRTVKPYKESKSGPSDHNF